MNRPMPSALLLGSNLLSFQAEVISQSKADIQDCLLYAELSACGLFNREQQWAQWIGTYQQVLGSIGMLRSAVIDHPQVKVKKRGDFQREATTLINAMPPPRLAEIASMALDAMFKSDHAKTFYSRWFNWGRTDSFQVIPCEHASTGNIHIMLCGLQMVTRTKPNLFFDPLLSLINPSSHELTILLKGGSFVFSVEAYTQHRQRVQKALLDMGAARISRIDL